MVETEAREVSAELSNWTQDAQNPSRASAADGSHPAVQSEYDKVRGRLSPKAQGIFDKVYAVADPGNRF